MSEKLIKLSADEMLKLDKLFRRSKRKIVSFLIAFAAISVIIGLIPMRILQMISPSSTASGNEDESQNLIQHWGFGWWLIIVLLLIAFFTFMGIRGLKILQLKKDLKEGEKLEVDVTVTKKVADNENRNYFIRVSSDTFKNKKITVEAEQFNQFTEGQKLTIGVYKNSMLLVSKSI